MGDNQPFSPDKAWELTLGQLQMQMTRATFETWVKNTAVVAAEDGVWEIGAQNAFAKDWLENRLLSTIQRTLTNILGRTVELKFVMTNGAAPAGNALQQQRLLTIQLADILNFDAYAVGYINHAHYIQQFWGAYLGAEAMQVWNYIRSFYLEPRYIYDKKEKAYLLNPTWTPWTPPLTWRAIDLARAIESRDDTEEGGNRKQITGAWRSCHRFKKEFDEGQAKDHCFCGLHAGHIHQAKPSEQYPNGRPTCRYWQPGILEQFETEGIALLERTGDPLKPRTIFYRAQVYQLLPYLTPAQVGQLHEVTQLQHREYLKNHGIDLKTWEGLVESCLMPAVVSWRGAEITPGAKNLLGTKSDFCPQ